MALSVVLAPAFLCMDSVVGGTSARGMGLVLDSVVHLASLVFDMMHGLINVAQTRLPPLNRDAPQWWSPGEPVVGVALVGSTNAVLRHVVDLAMNV